MDIPLAPIFGSGDRPRQQRRSKRRRHRRAPDEDAEGRPVRRLPPAEPGEDDDHAVDIVA
jgi:hypothetical protein